MIASDGETDWDVFKDVIEVISMQNDMKWVKKYYTEEQLADLARRGTPEVLEQGQQKWSVLLKDVEAAINEGVEPSSERAQRLAERWNKLIDEFTGGDPGILDNLRKLYADQANWPSTFEKPFTDGASSFIAKAAAARSREN
jgi:hypothetical protein